jgi:hypothetical protein
VAEDRSPNGPVTPLGSNGESEPGAAENMGCCGVLALLAAVVLVGFGLTFNAVESSFRGGMPVTGAAVGVGILLAISGFVLLAQARKKWR